MNYADSKPTAVVPGPVQTRDIQSVGINKSGGKYHVTGIRTDKQKISWDGVSRDNAIAALEKFLGRLV